jgi:hypothetical protein
LTTEKLNRISIEISVNSADPVTSATADGYVFTAAERLAAINAARQEIYRQQLETMGPYKMAITYPEYQQQTYITINSGQYPKPSDCKKVLNCIRQASGAAEERTREVTAENELQAKLNTYSGYYSKPGSWAWIERNTTIEIINELPADMIPNNRLKITYLGYINIINNYNGAEDIKEIETLIPAIKALATEYLLQMIQND